MISHVKSVKKKYYIAFLFVLAWKHLFFKEVHHMDRKELIKKISNLLQTFDLVTLLAIYRTLKRVQKGAVNEKDAD